jgi:molybdopterin synthase catalytic subunit
MWHIRVQTDPITDGGFAPAGQSGALVRFCGVVRTNADQSLSHLVLEHFPEVTEREIERIALLASERWALQHVLVVHRVGRIAVGEEIVRVETASAHRRDAYEANAFIMDYLKTQAPFWKQECFVDGRAVWVEAKGSDQLAQQRWGDAHPAGGPGPSFRPRVGAIILAGGEGSRMGHANKGLQMLAGKPLVQHVIDAIAPQVDHVAISANRDLPRYEALGFPVAPDAPGFQGMGPLAGIWSALPALPAHVDCVLAVPCDTPRLPRDLVSRLATALHAPGAHSASAQSAHAAAMAQSTDGAHPLVALFKPMLALQLPAHLHGSGKRRVRDWLQAGGCVPVHFDEPALFANINDPAALLAMNQRGIT